MVTALHRLGKVSSDYLITLAVVAETGNISEAAAVLGLSQPAVSQQLKALSHVVGEKLHHRSAHGVALTQAGESLAREAAPMLRGFRSVVEYLSSLEQGESGVLSIASSNTVAAYVLPHWLIAYRQRFQGVRIYARSTNSELVIAALHHGDVEVGLIETPDPIDDGEFIEVAVGGDELILVCSPKLARFASEEVTWDDIAHLPMVWRELGSGVRSTVERAMARGGFSPVSVFELAGGEAVKEAIVVGLGIGFISSHAVAREVEEGTIAALRLVGLDPLLRRFRLVSRSYGDLSLPARNFYDLVVN